jgi:cobalt-zinc-cadmium efflux system outer membrane protein
VTLAELEAIASERNPTLVQAAMQVEAARGTCIQAGLRPNPVIGYLGEDMGTDGTAGQQGGFVQQELVTAGKLRLRRNVAGHAVEQAEHALEAQRLRVLTDVRAGYYDVLVTQRMVDINEELVRIEEENTKATEQLLEAKEVSRVDVLQARVEAETTRIRLYGAGNRHQAAWRQLAALIGFPEMEHSDVAGNLDESLPELDWNETLTRLLAASPELAQARAGVQRAQCEVASQIANRVPNVGVLGGLRYDNAVQDTIATLQISVPLPVSDRNQGNIYKAQAGLIAARKEIDRLQLALRNRLAAVYEEYQTSRYQFERYVGDVIPKARESLDLVTVGYRQGELSYLQLLTAQRTFANVNLRYLDAMQTLRNKSVAIEGMLLSGGLGPGFGALQ